MSPNAAPHQELWYCKGFMWGETGADAAAAADDDDDGDDEEEEGNQEMI